MVGAVFLYMANDATLMVRFRILMVYIDASQI